MLSGFVIALVWPHLWVAKEHGGIEIYNLPLAFICAFVINVIFSYLMPKKNETN